MTHAATDQGLAVDNAIGTVESEGKDWPVHAPGDGLIELTVDEAQSLHDGAQELFSELDAGASLDDEVFLAKAEGQARRAPGRILDQLVRFRNEGNREGILLLRGLPIDDPLPATPADGYAPGVWDGLPVASGVQLILTSILGSIVAYSDEKRGRLLQDVCPLPGKEGAQENSGSSLLELHTEDGFLPHPPELLTLLGLRSDANLIALTVVSSARIALETVSPAARHELSQPNFRTRLSSSFVGDNAVYSGPTPILSGYPDDPDLMVDFHATEPLTEEAHSALNEIREALLSNLRGVALRPGDLLVVDNWKAVHGRTGFVPVYSGGDRWLRRSFAINNLHQARPAFNTNSRVHRALDISQFAAGISTGS